MKSYKDAYKKLKEEHYNSENKHKENDFANQHKLDNYKDLLKGNESLKNDLELTRNEIKYLKNQVYELEKSDKMLKNLLVTKKVTDSLH